MDNREIQAMIDELEAAHEFMRSLASQLGAGRHNAPVVTTKAFEDKISWGVDQLVNRASQALIQERQVAAARRLVEAIRPILRNQCDLRTADKPYCGACLSCLANLAIRDFETTGTMGTSSDKKG